MALGSLSERTRVMRSGGGSDEEGDSEDEEIVYCRSDDLDSSVENSDKVRRMIIATGNAQLGHGA